MRIVTLASFSRSASRARPTVAAPTPRTFVRAVTHANLASRLGSSSAGFDVAARSFTTSTPKRNTKPEMAPAKLELKTPKGTRDWGGEGIILREQIFDTSRLLPSLISSRRVRASLWGTAPHGRVSCHHRRSRQRKQAQDAAPPVQQQLTRALYSQDRLRTPRSRHDRYPRLRAQGHPDGQVRRGLEADLRPGRPGRRALLPAL